MPIQGDVLDNERWRNPYHVDDYYDTQIDTKGHEVYGVLIHMVPGRITQALELAARYGFSSCLRSTCAVRKRLCTGSNMTCANVVIFSLQSVPEHR